MRSRALQVPEDDVEDVDHVVTGARGEDVREGDQGGHLAISSEIGELGDPGVLRVAGQHRDPAGRQPGEVEIGDTEGTDLCESLERLDQARDRGTERGPAQSVQLGAAFPLGDHQEALEAAPKLRRRPPRKVFPEPARGPLAYARHKPTEHVGPRQEDALGEHPAMCCPEQRRGPEVVGPGLTVEPEAE